MVIGKRRIRKIHKYLKQFKSGEKFYIGFSQLDGVKDRMKEMGFSADMEVGERLLPPPLYGPKTRFNAIGLAIPIKNLPMETVYHSREWNRKDWQGYEHQDIVDVPYPRYQRKIIPPPSYEIQIHMTPSNTKFVSSDRLEYSDENYEKIKILMNMFLEMFGSFDFFSESMVPALTAPSKKLHWEILPKGAYPWEKVKEILSPLIERVKKTIQPVILLRLEKINNMKPDFFATGKAGFLGYVVFGFERKSIYVMESIYHGNATYVFDEDWESLSMRTKKEILDDNLQKQRIIHREKWVESINVLLE